MSTNKKNKNLKFIFLFIFFTLILSSCKIKKDLVYLNKGTFDTNSLNEVFTLKFKKGDILNISINSIDSEASKPFNIQQYNRNFSGGFQDGSPVVDGYLIDNNGEINFPVIGKIKLEGLDRIEAINLITNLIDPYLKEATVNIRISNFRISILGSVKNPGTFTIPNERITIFEAFGLAGDMKITGKRKNVLVLRDSLGFKQEIRMDLTSKSIVNSKAYYLYQNDVIYVEPNLNERYSSSFVGNMGLYVLSGLSVVLALINLIVN
jgi:polysaccharide biosynthesis/export protein